MTNNTGIDFFDNIGVSSDTLTNDSSQIGATIKQNDIQNVVGQRIDSLLKPDDKLQDTTKPYRIIFQGELIHD